MGQAVHVDGQIDADGLRLLVEHVLHLDHGVRKADDVLVEGHLAALDAAHIQNVVHQAQQVVAGQHDLAQAVAHAISVVQVIQRDGRKARDGIHGRAEIVGHVGEEGRFRLARMLGQIERILQRHLLAQLLAHLAGDVAGGQDDLRVALGQTDDAQLHVLLLVAEQPPIAHGEISLPRLQPTPQGLAADFRAHPGAVLDYHEGVDVALHGGGIIALRDTGQGEFRRRVLAAPVYLKLLRLQIDQVQREVLRSQAVDDIDVLLAALLRQLRACEILQKAEGESLGAVSVIEAHAQPPAVGKAPLLIEGLASLEEGLHLLAHLVAQGTAEGEADELGQADIVAVHAALLAGLLRQKHLTVAHIVEEQTGGRLFHGALGGQDPVRHVVDGESAQTLGNGEHLGAEELLEHLGRCLELRSAALVRRLVEVVEPDGIAAP